MAELQQIQINEETAGEENISLEEQSAMQDKVAEQREEALKADPMEVATAAEEQVDTKDTTEEVKEEATEAAPETEAVESNDEPEAVAEDKSDDRVKELEAQLADLKKILEDSINKTEDAVEAPELPVKEDEGLTHSPEAEVAVKRTKIGNKGGSIMSNVFKYINN